MHGYDPHECYLASWVLALHFYRKAQARRRWWPW